MDSTTKNTIRFKGQLLKTYLGAMFPKSFFKIKELDGLDNTRGYQRDFSGRAYYGNDYVISFSYLNKMYVDSITVTSKNVDVDLESYKTNQGFLITDIKTICDFRNDLCKIISVPSKLTLSGSDKDSLTIQRNGVFLTAKGTLISVKAELSKKDGALMGSSRYGYTFPESHIKLASSKSITEDEKVKIKKVWDLYSSINSTLYKRVSEMRDNVTLDFANIKKQCNDINNGIL